MKPRSTPSKQPNPKAHENQQSSDKKETFSEKPPVKESASSNVISVVHSSAGESAGVITHCRIVQVILFHKNNPVKTVKVYALLDDASDTTFVTTQVQRELGIEGVETSLDLSTMPGRERLMVQRVDGLVVQHFDRRIQIELRKAYARQSIPSRRDQIPRPETADNWPHLKRIQDEIPPCEEKMEIGLVIRCN